MNKILLIVIVIIVFLVITNCKTTKDISNELFVESEKNKSILKEPTLNKKQKNVRFNLNNIEICNDDYSTNNINENHNYIQNQTIDSNDENELLNNYVFNTDFIDNNPMNNIDNKSLPYTEFLKLNKYTEKDTNHIQLNRMYDIQNNANRYNTQRIQDVYDNIVDNQVLNTKNPNNQTTFYNEGVNGNKTITNDLWGYENENIANGGQIENGLYAHDPQDNNNMVAF